MPISANQLLLMLTQLYKKPRVSGEPSETKFIEEGFELVETLDIHGTVNEIDAVLKKISVNFSTFVRKIICRPADGLTITTLPESLTLFPNLFELTLLNCNFSDIPDAVFNCANLRRLRLHNNIYLMRISPDINKLGHLEELEVVNSYSLNNDGVRLDFSGLVNLMKCDLSCCDLREPPLLPENSAVETLLMQGNALGSIPPDVCIQPALRALIFNPKPAGIFNHTIPTVHKPFHLSRLLDQGVVLDQKPNELERAQIVSGYERHCQEKARLQAFLKSPESNITHGVQKIILDYCG